MNPTPQVLFVCVHNAGRSQMAAAFLNAATYPATISRFTATPPVSVRSTVSVSSMWPRCSFSLNSFRIFCSSPSLLAGIRRCRSRKRWFTDFSDSVNPRSSTCPFTCANPVIERIDIVFAFRLSPPSCSVGRVLQTASHTTGDNPQTYLFLLPAV